MLSLTMHVANIPPAFARQRLGCSTMALVNGYVRACGTWFPNDVDAIRRRFEPEDLRPPLGERAVDLHQGGEEPRDSVQPLLQVGGRQAVVEPEVLIDPEVIAGYSQHIHLIEEPPA
jgi:hypothetical protein